MRSLDPICKDLDIEIEPIPEFVALLYPLGPQSLIVDVCPQLLSGVLIGKSKVRLLRILNLACGSCSARNDQGQSEHNR